MTLPQREKLLAVMNSPHSTDLDKSRANAALALLDNPALPAPPEAPMDRVAQRAADIEARLAEFKSRTGPPWLEESVNASRKSREVARQAELAHLQTLPGRTNASLEDREGPMGELFCTNGVVTSDPEHPEGYPRYLYVEKLPTEAFWHLYPPGQDHLDWVQARFAAAGLPQTVTTPQGSGISVVRCSGGKALG